LNGVSVTAGVGLTFTKPNNQTIPVSLADFYVGAAVSGQNINLTKWSGGVDSLVLPVYLTNIAEPA